MGLKLNHISASHHVSHEGAGLIAVTGALAFAKHDGGHTMPDAETYFFVAGERGDGLTKSTFGGDVEIGGRLTAPELELEERLIVPELWNNTKLNIIAPEIGLDGGLVTIGEAAGPGYAVYQDIIFKNASNPGEIVEVYYQDGGSLSVAAASGDVTITLDSGVTSASAIIAAVLASGAASALVSAELKPGSLGSAAQSVTGAGAVLVATLPIEANAAPADASFYVAHGVAVFNEEIAVSGSASFVGAVEMGSTLEVAGAATFLGNAEVQGNLEVDGTLLQRGAATLESSLVVTGAAEFVAAVEMGSTLEVAGAATFLGNAEVQGNAEIDGTLLQRGAATLESSLVVTGAAEFVAGVSMLSTLDVDGVATFASDAEVQGNLEVDGTLLQRGAATLESTLVVTGVATFVSDAEVQGNLEVDGTLLQRGAATLESSLVVTGAATFVSNAEVQGNMEIDGTLLQRGAATLESSLVVSGASEFIGNMVIDNASFDLTSTAGTMSFGELSVESLGNIILDAATSIHMTGTVFVQQDPTQPLEVATKQYVDQVSSSGFSISGSAEHYVAGQEFTVSGGDTLVFKGTQSEIEISFAGDEIQIGLPDSVSITSNLTVGGDLVVNGEVTTLNTTNLTVEDVVIGLNSGGVAQNANGGIAIFSGSSDSDLVLGRVANDTWGVGKKDTEGGTVTSLADMALVNMRASRFEIDSASDYIDVETDLKVVAAQGIVLDAAADIELNADGGDFLFQDGAQLGLKLSISGEDVLFQDAGQTEIFRLDASADSLLMASGLKVEFGGAARYIHNDTNDLKMVGGALIKIEAGDDIELKAAGGDFLFKDGSLTAMTLSISGEDALVKNYGGVEIFRLDDSADSLLMASEKKIEFGSNSQYIHNNASNHLVAAAASHIVLDSGDELHLDAQNGILRLKDAGVEVAHLDFSGADLQIKAVADMVLDADGGQIEFKDAGVAFLKFDMALGAILPATDLAIDLGSSEYRFNNMYTGDLHLQNDRGHWTLIEEENFITFRNNKNGRRFKMIMEDITGTGTYGPGNDGEM